MDVPDRLRLPLDVDPAPLAAEAAALDRQDWIHHFVTQNYAGNWDVIPLRGPAGATHPVMMIQSDPSRHDYADTPFLDACPAIRAALERFACPLEAVRLMRLGPGSVIREHRDHDLDFAQGCVRIHVPLITHPGVVFTLNGRRVVLEAGSAWYLRLSDPHAVENPGPGARVHLVIDARVDPWIEALFASALGLRARAGRMSGRDWPDEAGFAAFRRRVAEDAGLAALLRPIQDPDALVAASVREGAARGFRFDAAEIEAEMAKNRHGWLMHPVPLIPWRDPV